MDHEHKMAWYNPITGLTSKIFEYKYHDTEEECLASIERVKQEVIAYIESVKPERIVITKCKYCNRAFREEGHLIMHERACKDRPKETDHA
jgi:hypothetical protein